MPHFRTALTLSLCILLTACQTSSEISSTTALLQQAQTQGLQPHEFQSSTFLLSTWQKLTAPNQNLVVYLEGDGHSMTRRTKASKDPTPHQALGLALALQDPSPNVIYLARPCQYNVNHDTFCEPKYWTSHRFSKAVRQTIFEAIEYYQQKAKAPQIELVGFSGGASLAAWVAANKSDTKSLITVSGDLNHTQMQLHHKTTPLSEDINLLEVAKKLTHLPQIHWVGEKDKVVPSLIAISFANAQHPSNCVTVNIVPNATHHKGWVSSWSDKLKTKPQCNT